MTSSEQAMSGNEITIWWMASTAVIGTGVLASIWSAKHSTYLASLAAAASGGLGMIYTLRLLWITGV